MDVFAGLEPVLASGLFVASFVGSFITVTFGIGGGVLVLAVMASILPPAALIPVHGVVQLGSNLFRTAVLAPHVYWTPFASFFAGSLIGIALGGALVTDLSPGLVQIGVGAFVIFSVFFRPPSWLGGRPWIAGCVSSCLTMFFGATGPFVAAFTRVFDLPRQAFVATNAVLMVVQHSLKITAFGVLGFAFGPWLLFCAVMIASGFLGTLCGRVLLLKMSDTLFRRVLNGVLVLLALRLIWQGSQLLTA
jgi:uncharacterized membrane protein YfcA